MMADQFKPQRTEGIFHIIVGPLMDSRKIDQIGTALDTMTAYNMLLTSLLRLAKAVQVVRTVGACTFQT
jgi:hypothetical protein